MSETHIKPEVYTSNITIAFYASLGVALMCVSGYWLVQGLSALDTGLDSIVSSIAGVLLQITEVACFVGAMTALHSAIQRKKLKYFGIFLFCVSMITISVAQRSMALKTEIAATKQEKINQLQTDQLESNEKLTDALIYNSKKQSKSIYQDSRKLGTESVYTARDIVEKNNNTRSELIKKTTNQDPILTGKNVFSDMITTIAPFAKKETVAWIAKLIEMLWGILKAFLVELSGALLISHAGSLHAGNKLLSRPDKNSLNSIPETVVMVNPDRLPQKQAQALSKKEKSEATQALNKNMNSPQINPKAGKKSIPETVKKQSQKQSQNRHKTGQRKQNKPVSTKNYGNKNAQPRRKQAKSVEAIAEEIRQEIINGDCNDFVVNWLKSYHRVGAEKITNVAKILQDEGLLIYHDNGPKNRWYEVVQPNKTKNEEVEG